MRISATRWLVGMALAGASTYHPHQLILQGRLVDRYSSQLAAILPPTPTAAVERVLAGANT